MRLAAGREWVGGGISERVRLRRHVHQSLLLRRKGIRIAGRRHDAWLIATMALRGHVPVTRGWLPVGVLLRRHGRAMVAVWVVVMRRHCAGRPVGRDAVRLVPVVSTRSMPARGVASRG